MNTEVENVCKLFDSWIYNNVDKEKNDEQKKFCTYHLFQVCNCMIAEFYKECILCFCRLLDNDFANVDIDISEIQCDINKEYHKYLFKLFNFDNNYFEKISEIIPHSEELNVYELADNCFSFCYANYYLLSNIRKSNLECFKVVLDIFYLLNDTPQRNVYDKEIRNKSKKAILLIKKISEKFNSLNEFTKTNFINFIKSQLTGDLDFEALKIINSFLFCLDYINNESFGKLHTNLCTFCDVEDYKINADENIFGSFKKC